MDKAIYDKGMAVRRAVLGDEYVDAALKSADDFNRPLQDMLNEYCWGAVWGREGLPRKTRSMLNLAMISVLNRPHELRAHIRGALRNGVTREEISEIFLQVMIYGGAPAAVDLFEPHARCSPSWTRRRERRGAGLWTSVSSVLATWGFTWPAASSRRVTG